jgi:hypothetical protein
VPVPLIVHNEGETNGASFSYICLPIYMILHDQNVAMAHKCSDLAIDFLMRSPFTLSHIYTLITVSHRSMSVLGLLIYANYISFHIDLLCYSRCIEL